jgi:hypothetical protein
LSLNTRYRLPQTVPSGTRRVCSRIGLLMPYSCRMSVEIEHPEIRYVVYPVHLDGTLTGELPRMRHDPDCGHYEWRDGKTLGTPVLATDEQMRKLRACKSCTERRSDSSTGDAPAPREGKLGQLYPACHQVMPLTGICDNRE